VKDEGADCGSRKNINLDGCKQYCDGRGSCRSFAFTSKWGGQCYCKKKEVTSESPTTHDNHGFTTYYKKPCGGSSKPDDGDGGAGPDDGDDGTDPGDGNSGIEPGDGDGSTEPDDGDKECWDGFAVGTKVKDEGADCGSRKNINLDGCKQYCDGRGSCRSFAFTSKWGGQCYCKKKVVTSESPTTHDNHGFTTYYKKPCGGGGKPDDGDGGSEPGDGGTDPDDGNSGAEPGDGDGGNEPDDGEKDCWGSFAEGTKVKDEGAGCGSRTNINVDGCKQYCEGRDGCKSFTFTSKWGGECYCKTQEVTSESPTVHDSHGFTTYYKKQCSSGEPDGGDGEPDGGNGEPDGGDGETDGGDGETPGSGEVHFQFNVGYFKPDIQCQFDDDAKGRGTARMQKFVSEGVSVIGLVQMEWEVSTAPAGYWYVGAQCRNPSQPFADPVIVMFKASEFDFVRGIGQSAKVEWDQLPYVADGSYKNVLSSGIDGYEDATSCTATNLNPGIGVRGFAGALVKHKQSGQEICVIAGTMPHGRHDLKAEWYNDEISRAGCKGKAMLFMFDQNYNGPHWDFDFKKEWGWGHDPGHDAPCDNHNRAGCTCCLEEGMDPNYKNLKYDRIAAFGPTDWGKQAVRVEHFRVEQDWVCRTKGEHKITSGTVVIKHS